VAEEATVGKCARRAEIAGDVWEGKGKREETKEGGEGEEGTNEGGMMGTHKTMFKFNFDRVALQKSAPRIGWGTFACIKL
jgi:hypothetical protein